MYLYVECQLDIKQNTHTQKLLINDNEVLLGKFMNTFG